MKTYTCFFLATISEIDSSEKKEKLLNLIQTELNLADVHIFQSYGEHDPTITFSAHCPYSVNANLMSKKGVLNQIYCLESIAYRYGVNISVHSDYEAVKTAKYIIDSHETIVISKNRGEVLKNETTYTENVWINTGYYPINQLDFDGIAQ